MRKITVFLEGKEETFFLGATVRELSERLPDAEKEAFLAGSLAITDGAGHLLGEGGALEAGERYRIFFFDQ
ncbi:MAG: hypothetical protein ACM3YO_02005 [Bacteroidota bacterium]